MKFNVKVGLGRIFHYPKQYIIEAASEQDAANIGKTKYRQEIDAELRGTENEAMLMKYVYIEDVQIVDEVQTILNNSICTKSEQYVKAFKSYLRTNRQCGHKDIAKEIGTLIVFNNEAYPDKLSFNDHIVGLNIIANTELDNETKQMSMF